MLYSQILLQPSGDMTRFVRNLKSVAESKYLNEFVEKEMDIVEKVLDNLPKP